MKSDFYSFKNYTFKGVGIFSIAIGLFIFIGIWIDNGVNLFKSWGCLFPILILLIFVVIGAVQLYYIELNEKELIVKNLIFFWYKKTYQRSEISSVRYYSKGGGKSSQEGIEITFLKRSGYSEKFMMCFFRDDFWKKMQEKLEYYKYPCFKKY
ncbi:hypothetical protein NQT66_14805 [Cellulophaga baltica]|uniref:hypothetical protein n=1 Tax=Cellulophaga baltica TaxID=76594 RepID=UPI002148DFD0|nr:hypothetical protein [Cellulophaga baltica]MCR1026090.1 hypothetical protein [Cellulophaga baltica]